MKNIILLIISAGVIVWSVTSSITPVTSIEADQPCETQAIKFVEWVYKNEYTKGPDGKWYISDCMAAGWPGDTSHTSKQLFKLFLKK